MLETLLAVTQDILTDITEVDVQLTVKAVRVSQRRIHQPELDILDIRFLEVGIVQFAHDTTPTILRICQLTVRIKLRRTHVIWSTLIRIEGHIQHS